MLTPQQGETRQALDSAEQALMKGDFSRCAALAGKVLDRDTLNVRAHLLRGTASNQLGHIERAVQDLAFVAERRPEEAIARFHLGQALRKAGQYDAALPHLRAVLKDQGLRPHGLFETARSLRGLGRLDKAIDHYHLLLKETPGHADAAANLAVLLEKTSQLDDALAWVDRALVLAPNNATAALTRARVMRRLGRFEEAAAQLETLLERPLPPMSRIIAANQLGHCLDRLGRHEEAFGRFTEANRLQQETDPEADVDDYGSYGIEWASYLRGWLAEHPPGDWSPTPPDERDAPAFLVGFPRSGTTLLDQVLSAHPRVEVIEEQELLLEVRRKWMSLEHFHRVHQMSEDEVHEARLRYRQALAAAHDNPDARVVVDKLPLNSLYLALIHRLFPEARLLYALRDPRDACLSCYFQTFTLVGAMPYFLELDSTVRYYDTIMGVATDARNTLPLKLLEVRYEQVVENFEQEARRMLGFLDLPWDEQVLTYRTNTEGRTINTPSYSQVSEPLYARSVGRWKHYTQQLAPVEPILAPWVERFGYDNG
ncbi:MAG: sulfotransferase [Pseudomonadota bacterium]